MDSWHRAPCPARARPSRARTRINAAFDGGTSRTVALEHWRGARPAPTHRDRYPRCSPCSIQRSHVQNDGSAALKSCLARGDVLVLEEWPRGAVARSRCWILRAPPHSASSPATCPRRARSRIDRLAYRGNPWSTWRACDVPERLGGSRDALSPQKRRAPEVEDCARCSRR